jgi:DNA invertase Pin-like site-specific DNA recombinase
MIAALRSRQPLTAAYIRVSSPKRNGQSRQDTRSQKARISEYAKAQGLTRIKWYEDYATGRTADRDGFQALLSDCRAGKVKTILTTELSRISRSLEDAIALLRELHKRNIKLVVVNQGLVFDNSPMSRFLFQVLGSLSELGSSIRSERIKAGLAASDKRPGRPRDETKRHKVRKLRDRGMTIQRIAAEMKMSKAGIYYLISTDVV